MIVIFNDCFCDLQGLSELQQISFSTFTCDYFWFPYRDISTFSQHCLKYDIFYMYLILGVLACWKRDHLKKKLLMCTQSFICSIWKGWKLVSFYFSKLSHQFMVKWTWKFTQTYHRLTKFFSALQYHFDIFLFKCFFCFIHLILGFFLLQLYFFLLWISL